MKTKEEIFVHFGKEWEKELMKWRKKHLVEFARTQCERILELEEKFCSCPNEIKTGWTSAHYCNICGKLEQSKALKS